MSLSKNVSIKENSQTFQQFKIIKEMCFNDNFFINLMNNAGYIPHLNINPNIKPLKAKKPPSNEKTSLLGGYDKWMMNKICLFFQKKKKKNIYIYYASALYINT